MRTYRRIEDEDRGQIHALRKAGKTQAAIGKALGFSQGPVSRELSRNKGRRGYRVKPAQRNAQSRPEQVRHKPRKLTSRVRRAIARKLREERWSPEPIRFWLRDARGVQLSHAWIYRMVWDNQHAGGDLWRSWRRRGKHSTRRGAPHAGSGVIPDRIDRAERPAVVNRTSRLGDWEGDTIVGARHKGALLTPVERKSNQIVFQLKLPHGRCGFNEHTMIANGLLLRDDHGGSFRLSRSLIIAIGVTSCSANILFR